MSNVNLSFCLDVLDRALRNSWYFLQSGKRASSYVNIDNAIVGVDFGTGTEKPQYDVMEGLADQFAFKIREIEEQEPFDRLVFIDKAGRGPVGMIALSSHIAYKSRKEAIFVRPYKNTLRSSIEGRFLNPGERLLIISDVATSGQTILKAASKLWEGGSVIVGALVFFDQEIGATENLSLKDISLYSILSRSKAKKSKGIAERLPDLKFESLRVFGGAM